MSTLAEQVGAHSQDTPAGRPDMDGRAGVFVPAADVNIETAAAIRKGAGIVGFRNADGTLTVYFEANRFDESSLHKWENKVRRAYERMVMAAPTVSKAKLDAKLLEQVGIIDGMGLHIKRPEALRRWLGVSDALDTAPEGNVVRWKQR